MSLCKYILQSEAVYIPAVSEGILAVLGHARVLVRSLPLAHNSEHSPSIIVVTKSRKVVYEFPGGHAVSPPPSKRPGNEAIDAHACIDARADLIT